MEYDDVPKWNIVPYVEKNLIWLYKYFYFLQKHVKSKEKAWGSTKKKV
jgi:hypothetical protein